MNRMERGSGRNAHLGCRHCSASGGAPRVTTLFFPRHSNGLGGSSGGRSDFGRGRNQGCCWSNLWRGLWRSLWREQGPLLRHRMRRLLCFLQSLRQIHLQLLLRARAAKVIAGRLAVRQRRLACLLRVLARARLRPCRGLLPLGGRWRRYQRRHQRRHLWRHLWRRRHRRPVQHSS